MTAGWSEDTGRAREPNPVRACGRSGGPISRRGALAGMAGAAGMATLGLAGRPAAAQARLKAVAHVALVGDLVARIGGDGLELVTLMGEGVDPHSYRQTRADIARMAAADILFAIGLNLEAQLERPLAEFAARKPVVLVGERLPRERLLADPEYADRFDPHVWMDAGLYSLVPAILAEALGALRPEAAAAFAQRASEERTALERVDAYARQAFATLPAERRVLVTAHDAFNYLGRAYGLDVHGIQGLSTEAEAGVRHIQELVGLLVGRRIPAVFVETSVADRHVRALVEGAAAQGHRLAIGGALFSDALGPPGRYEGTVVGMLDHNITTIVRALGGNAPARGLHGRLAGHG